ncbi:uncharacterized [Tachysurus ichikawai]
MFCSTGRGSLSAFGDGAVRRLSSPEFRTKSAD